MEIWKDAVGFPGYKVSDLGNVCGKYGRILKPELIDGYHYLGLCGKKRKYVRVHRLVAAAFLGPCPAGQEVDHYNDIRDDNRVVNLHYVTPSENMRKQAKQAGCSSTYIGVSLVKITKKPSWKATATSAEKRVHLGTFDIEEEAARARDKFYRDRGYLVVFNFPE